MREGIPTGHNVEREGVVYMAMLAEAEADRRAAIVADYRAGRISRASAEKSLASIRRAEFPGRVGKLVKKANTTATQPRGRKARAIQPALI